jgi:hypothetical protein
VPDTSLIYIERTMNKSLGDQVCIKIIRHSYGNTDASQQRQTNKGAIYV